MAHRQLEDNVGFLGVNDLEGSIEKAIEFFLSTKESAENAGYSELRLSVCDGEVDIIGTRNETDKERDKRLSDSRRHREDKKKSGLQHEADEAAEYRRLKEKYEPETTQK